MRKAERPTIGTWPPSDLLLARPTDAMKRALQMAGVLLATVMTLALGNSMAVAAPAAPPTIDVAPAATAAPLDLNQCTATASNPHFSTGAGGIIFKINLACRVSHRIDIVVARMWKCPNPPTGAEETYTAQGCTVPAYEQYRDQSVTAGTRGSTWYAPRPGKPGVHGRGYFVGVGAFDDVGHVIKDYSQIVYLDR